MTRLLLLALLAGCSPSPETAPRHSVCGWPESAGACCTQPPRLERVLLADLRAERWGR